MSNRQMTRTILPTLLAFAATSVLCSPPAVGQSLSRIVAEVQPKVVKIVGSGGFRGLEPYQTGILISPDGHVLTAWSYVLDSDVISVTLDDGQRFSAELIGYDPKIEIALLKIPAGDFASFDMTAPATVRRGTQVLAFSNLYGVANGNESVSVQKGVVASTSRLSARRGATVAAYDQDILVLDAMTNNPGAAGGAVTTLDGRLVGLIGKELKDNASNSWLNFAIPIAALSDSVNQILSGKMVIQSTISSQLPTEPITLKLAGIALVPDVVAKTPPFVETTRMGSSAHQSGILPDDLIVEINGTLTPSINSVKQQLLRIDRDTEFEVTVQRAGQFLTFKLGLLR